MKMSDDSGILSIDFLVGFTIFLLAFIWVVSMIPGLLINLQGYTIDYDAVAYRTGVILAEDPGEPSLPTSFTPWENLLSRDGVVRFGLALSKDTPNILSQRKVDRFFCLSVFSYPVDYQSRIIFGDYPYQFNISLLDIERNETLSVGDILPATSSYGSIRRFVKIKGPSIGMVNASSYDVSGSYNKTAHPEYLNGENETLHEFSIVINNTELLHGKVKDQTYQIDPSKDQIIINFTKLNQTMYPDRKDCFNISLTDINVRNAQLIRLDPLPEINSVIDGIPYNQSSTLQQNISNNISLIFDPPTYWSGIEQIYINLTFNLTPNPVCNAGIFSGTDPVRGSRFLNNTFNSPFKYNYDSKNVMQPQLRDAVLEINIGSGARTVTEIIIEGLNAAFTYGVTSGSPSITVQFTDQSTGPVTEYDWDFGDGTPLDHNNNPLHPYAAQGIYTVTLKVYNSTRVGDSTIIKTIDLSAPVAGFSGTPLSGNEPLSVQFTDTSTGGVPSLWNWEYQNATVLWTQFSTAQNPSISFPAGIYDIRLNVTNFFGSSTSTKTSYITVLPPVPVANFTASPLSGNTPLIVAFTDTSTNTPTSWKWEYQNATVLWTQFSTAQNPSISFPAGIYDIRLTATNLGGSDDEIKTGYITVTNMAPPVAGFTGTPTSGNAPLTVVFTDSSTNSPTSWRWAYKTASVGWTQFATTQNPSFAFAAGKYDINLTATNAGGSNTYTRTVYITAYTIQSFTSSTTWIAPAGVTSVEYLVVAGGGGGGGTTSYGYGGGGGGAGGLLTGTVAVTPLNSYTVVVGAGGAGGAAGAYSGTKGSDSRFGTIISTGGGYGAGTSWSSVAGGSGGSGGGGVSEGAGGARIPGQGYVGGSDTVGWPDLCGGGGGSSQAGGATTTTAAGKGGDGTASSISGSPVTYAGGGGGGSGSVYSGAPGGTGGGGAGGATVANKGADATGYGSGGGGGTSTDYVGARAGGKGSNGIVIIRYS
jgi:PKD repeat protein